MMAEKMVRRFSGFFLAMLVRMTLSFLREDFDGTKILIPPFAKAAKGLTLQATPTSLKSETLRQAQGRLWAPKLYHF
jgi:hypothetical protein